MAIAFRASNTAGGASGADLVITKPAGTADNDILILSVFSYTNAGTLTMTGWTTIRTDTRPSGDPIAEFHCRTFWKRAVSEGANYTLDFSASGYRAASIAAYSGCITSGSPIAASNGANGAASTSQAVTTITTVTNGSMLILTGSANAGAGYTAGSSPATNERTDTGGSTIYDGIQATAGATGTMTLTHGVSDLWAATLIALEPDTGGGAPAMPPFDRQLKSAIYRM